MAAINKPRDGKQPHSRARAGRTANGSAGATTTASARKGAEAAADAASRAGDAASDTPRGNIQAAAESQLRMAQDAAQKFEDAARKMAGATKGATEDESRLMALPNAAEGGLRDLRQNMAGLVEGVVRTNLRMAQELFSRNDPASVAELQRRFLREYTDALLRGGAALAQAVQRIAEETPRPSEKQTEQRGQANQDQQRFQAAGE